MNEETQMTVEQSTGASSAKHPNNWHELPWSQISAHVLQLQMRIAKAERADPNSYGFRPKRSTHDAREQCFNALEKRNSPRWVLEGDISACFDRISHEWLVRNIPMDKIVLWKFLKAGFMENGEKHQTTMGTPQHNQ